MARDIHVVKQDGIWKTKKEDCKRSSGNFNTQKEAIDFARSIAKKEKTELFIHGVDGKIRDRDTYGNDPCPPKDKRY